MEIQGMQWDKEYYYAYSLNKWLGFSMHTSYVLSSLIYWWWGFVELLRVGLANILLLLAGNLENILDGLGREVCKRGLKSRFKIMRFLFDENNW